MPLILAGIITALTAAFSRIIASQLGRWLLQALLFFGISFVSSKLVSGAVTPTLINAFSGLGSSVVQWISFLNVDKCLTTILSAYGAVAASRWTITRTKATP